MANFFSEQYKARFTLPNGTYADVKNGLQPFFMTEKERGINVADVVCVEPQCSAAQNQFMREKNPDGHMECEYLLITSVRPVGDGTVVHGFVRLNDVPRPLNNIINALHTENLYLRNAVKRMGGDSDLIALGAE